MATLTGTMAGPGPSRRPRLTLQTTPAHHGSSVRRGKSYGNTDIKSPTALNTLSNVYATAIERSTPTQSTSLAAKKLQQSLKLRTDIGTLRSHQPRVLTPSISRPATPSSDSLISPAQRTEVVYPSTMTPTPPLSAEIVDPERRIFTFPSMEISRQIASPSPAPSRRRVSFADLGPPVAAPYTHNKSLHSILRNSPLQPATAKSPSSQRRQSIRLQEKAARRVGYGSPLTQTITTEKYIKSHIDLLVEEASPYTPSAGPKDSDMILDLTMAYSGDETKDGGQTPGPFEEMRRRMTSLATETTVRSPRPDGIQKRRRKEKKRKWVWTIGKEDEESESGAIAALRAAEKASLVSGTNATNPEPVRIDRVSTPEPLTAIKTSSEWIEPESDPTTETEVDCMDIDMSETSSFRSSGANSPL
ncbi:hypothetical protein EKO27_g4082 [Xylaria grammica]|uniref:Uncharacterized protein n=1 Tax=Xylaria grammica TaxID=363999 RepID=A0A439D9I9_9PEZI|nr:hypothetical protein EKO27_g4082 [Xylaria grammica]